MSPPKEKRPGLHVPSGIVPAYLFLCSFALGSNSRPPRSLCGSDFLPCGGGHGSLLGHSDNILLPASYPRPSLSLGCRYPRSPFCGQFSPSRLYFRARPECRECPSNHSEFLSQSLFQVPQLLHNLRQVSHVIPLGGEL